MLTIVPASSASTIQSELAQASSCAAEANLTLNLGKTQEIIITRSNHSCHKQTIPVTAGHTSGTYENTGSDFF